MEKELINFIRENGLSPFHTHKTSVRSPNNSIYKTKDAKAIHTKVLGSISRHFVFAESANLFSLFAFSSSEDEIRRRQHFFSSISESVSNDFLKEIKLERVSWKPPYGVLVVTEDEKTFVTLQKMGCPVKILLNERDVLELEDSDIVQVIDCDQYRQVLERLPQSVFLKSIDEAYLERYVELLSRWKGIIEVLKRNDSSDQIRNLVHHLDALLPLLEKESKEKLTRERVEDSLETIKDTISERIRGMSVAGSSLIEVVSKGVLPDELKKVVDEEIERSGLPDEIFFKTIPVRIDEAELEKTLRKQSLTEFSSVAERIQGKSKELCSVPQRLKELEEKLLYFDFCSGVSQWMRQRNNFPQTSSRLGLTESANLFLENPQPITFGLNEEKRCSILTGANSGGKTTLLEHILQAISCLQLGLPTSGTFLSPLFSEVYYFAKNKGSMSKGAFETLLTQMSEIRPGEKTLILADEIEAVTEPGVAGRMISATAKYFIEKKCYLVIATHLGHEIAQNLPENARIDGIEAKGLSEDNELIVDHNPLLGKLAHSTPELIIERMVKTKGGDYFEFLHHSISHS